MSDLISKRTAIDALRAIKQGLWEIDIPSPTVPEYVEHHEQIKNMMEIVDGWIKRIKEEPAVDAVSVVRCRDCKYSYIFEPWEGKDAVRYCNRLRWACAKDSDLPVYDDDFCSHGERREE